MFAVFNSASIHMLEDTQPSLFNSTSMSCYIVTVSVISEHKLSH